MEMLGSILGGVGSIIGAGLQSNANKNALNYQKERDQVTMQREDNAMQRRVADMKLAGINPLLAAGTAGAAASSGPTPVVDNSGEMLAKGAEGAGQMLNSVMLQKEMMKNQAGLLAEQVKNVQADTIKKGAETANLVAGDPEAKAQAELANKRSNTSMIEQNRWNASYDSLDREAKSYGKTISELDATLKGGIPGIIAGGGGGSKKWEKYTVTGIYGINDDVMKGRITKSQANEIIRQIAKAGKTKEEPSMVSSTKPTKNTGERRKRYY